MRHMESQTYGRWPPLSFYLCCNLRIGELIWKIIIHCISKVTVLFLLKDGLPQNPVTSNVLFLHYIILLPHRKGCCKKKKKIPKETLICKTKF